MRFAASGPPSVRAELMLVERLDLAPRRSCARRTRRSAGTRRRCRGSWLLPPRVTTLVVAPPVPPYSGGALCVRIRNSAIASTGILQREAAVHAVHVLRAVDEIDVLLGPHAVHGIGLTLAQRPAGRRDAGGQRRDAGLQQAELREVAAVQRQIDELAAGDDACRARWWRCRRAARRRRR